MAISFFIFWQFTFLMLLTKIRSFDSLCLPWVWLMLWFLKYLLFYRNEGAFKSLTICDHTNLLLMYYLLHSNSSGSELTLLHFSLWNSSCIINLFYLRVTEDSKNKEHIFKNYVGDECLNSILFSKVVSILSLLMFLIEKRPEFQWV